MLWCQLSPRPMARKKNGSSVFMSLSISVIHTWWLIPLSKWVITPVINGISRVNPLITGVITHLLSGMSHQVSDGLYSPDEVVPRSWTRDFEPNLTAQP